MRLKNFTAESDVDATMDYLEKRHPLYFMNKKFQKAQVRDLVQRIRFRLISKAKVGASKTGKDAPKSAADMKPAQKEKENEKTPAQTTSSSKVTFKSGSQLPSLSEDKKLPSVTSQQLPSVQQKASNVLFDDQIELSDHDSEFDASDLLDDNQQKRSQKTFQPEKSVLNPVQPPAFIKNVAKPIATTTFNNPTSKAQTTKKAPARDDDGWGDMSP